VAVALNIVGPAQAGKNEDATADIDNGCRPLLAQLVHKTDVHATYTHERAVAIARAFADRFTTEVQPAAGHLSGRGGRQPMADEQGHEADRRIGSDDPGGFRARVTDIIIGEIAAASTEHSRGIDQMNLTISRPAIPSSLPSAPVAHTASAALRNFRSRPPNARHDAHRARCAAALIPVMHF